MCYTVDVINMFSSYDNQDILHKSLLQLYELQIEQFGNDVKWEINVKHNDNKITIMERMNWKQFPVYV